MTPEGKIKQMVDKAIRRNLSKHSGKIWRFMPVQRGMGKQALDYLLCVNGNFVAVETKRDPKHIPTAMQQVTIREIRLAGGIVFIVNDQPSCFMFEQALEQLILHPEMFHAFYHSEQTKSGAGGPENEGDDAVIP